MTELEKIEYTKNFVDKMANGINPLDDTAISESDLLSNVRLSGCMKYVSEILGKVIANGGFEKKPRKVKFAVTQEQLQNYEFDPYPISVTEISKKMTAVSGGDSMKKLSTRAINNWLSKAGMLEITVNEFGNQTRRPTEAGRELGIITENKVGKDGHSYTAVLYNREAQQFILDNIDAILEEKEAADRARREAKYGKSGEIK